MFEGRCPCDSAQLRKMLMWGDGRRVWFELFAGMVVYRGGEPTTGENVGWLNVNDIEGRFRREQLTFQGRKYEPTDKQQKNALLEAIISQASALCYVRLLERRRQMDPPSLDYRVTRLGRRIDNWGYGDGAGFRKRAVFFLIEAFFRLKSYWKVIAIGAAGWALLNAFKFYGAVWSWAANDAFATVSAIVVAVVVWLGHVALLMLSK
jgi:hypothetical protein